MSARRGSGTRRCKRRCTAPRVLPGNEGGGPRPCRTQSCTHKHAVSAHATRTDAATRVQTHTWMHTDLSALMYCEGTELQRTPATCTCVISLTCNPRFSPSMVTRVPPSRGPVRGLICGRGGQSPITSRIYCIYKNI